MPVWGGTLQERREAIGLSRDQLAARSGVTGETIRRIESGIKTTTTTKRKIDAALALGPEEDRFSRLEREVAELRRDLAALLGFAERLLGQQESLPASSRSGPRSIR